MSEAVAMPQPGRRFALPSAVWPLADQGLVSVGGFIVNLTLARSMPPESYGIYSLLFMAMLQIQVVSGSLLFYPLCVRGTVMEETEQAMLFGSGLLLAVGISIPLGALLAGGLFAAGHTELIAPAVLWLLLWQVQEMLRRGLFTQLRHASAIPGDVVRYCGQAVALIALAAAGSLTLVHAVTAMAVAAGIAAIWQATQVRMSFAGVAEWRQTASGFCRIGLGSLGSNLLSTMSLQIYPWCLAITAGAAFAASFQAALNIVMVVNPVLIGLCNIIPQAVAREARTGGMRQAWRASRMHMVLGAVPMLGFYVLAIAWPQPILATLYGHASPYTALSMAVRLMAAAGILGFGVEMVIAFLHGIQRTQLSMQINSVGLLTATLIGLPLAVEIGIPGACIGIACANVARVIAAVRVLTRVLQDAPVHAR
jgi:O-antigen/teichoic acid export membrane protein